jgi:hypothetical protein
LRTPTLERTAHTHCGGYLRFRAGSPRSLRVGGSRPVGVCDSRSGISRTQPRGTVRPLRCAQDDLTIVRRMVAVWTRIKELRKVSRLCPVAPSHLQPSPSHSFARTAQKMTCAHPHEDSARPLATSAPGSLPHLRTAVFQPCRVCAGAEWAHPSAIGTAGARLRCDARQAAAQARGERQGARPSPVPLSIYRPIDLSIYRSIKLFI